MSDSSFVANGSPACMTKNAIHMVNIIGMRQRRNRLPSMNPNEQKISANSTNQRDNVLPSPMGLGNVSVASLYRFSLAMPCERNRNPKIMRAKSNIIDFVDEDIGSLNRAFNNFFLDIICGVSFV